MISIVIANYNGGSYLEQSICSVLNQSCNKYELIVVDGGSSDNSIEIIKKYSDRIAWWISEVDKGQSDAFNKGFSKAKGSHYLWLNSDDILLPRAVEKATEYLQKNTKCKWLVGDTVYFKDGLIYRCLKGPYWNSWLMKQTQVCNMVNGPSAIFQRELFESVGGFNINYRYAMDMDLWIKFANMGERYYRLKRYMWAFRIHGGSKTASSIRMEKSQSIIDEENAILKKYGRTKSKKEVWLLRMYKLVTGTHIFTMLDTLKWRSKRLIQFIDALR